MVKARFDYNKNRNDVKSGRKLHSGGPRDRQRELAQQDAASVDSGIIVEALQSQISELKDELKQSVSAASPGGFTQDDLEKEIRKSSKAIEDNYIKEIEGLKLRFKNSQAENIKNIEASDGVISELKTKLKVTKSEKGNIESELLVLKTTSDSKDEKINDLNDRIKEQKETIALLNKRPITLVEGVGQVIDEDRPKMETVFIDPIEAGAEEGLESHVKVKDIPTEEKNDNADKVDKLRSILGKGKLK